MGTRQRHGTTRSGLTSCGASALLVTLLTLGCGGAVGNQVGDASRITTDNIGGQTNGDSTSPSINNTGTLLAFASDASDIHLGDSNGVTDLFLHNVTTGATTLISKNAGGFMANGPSSSPVLSADGSKIAFISAANDLVGNDFNLLDDLFLYDVATAATTRLSLDSLSGQTNGASADPAISADGSKVAFTSLATDLVSAIDGNGGTDIFVRDTGTNTTSRVSERADNTQADGVSTDPAISGDGKFVAFVSDATNLSALIDGNGAADIFIHELATGTTSRVSLRDNDAEANGASRSPSLSNDGRYLAFVSTATDLLAAVTTDTNFAADIFLRDRQTGTTTRLSLDSNGTQANGSSDAPVISADGRYVVFTSDATNLVSGDSNGLTDVFVRDTAFGTTIRLSNGIGSLANGASTGPSLSANGAVVAFTSSATNLVVGDTNAFDDIFLVSIPTP